MKSPKKNSSRSSSDQPNQISRRTFIQQAAAVGALLPVAGRAGLVLTGSPAEASGNFFSVHFDPATGRLDVQRRDGSRLLHRAVLRAETDNTVFSTAQVEFSHSVEVNQFRDTLGQGRQMVIRSADARRQMDLEWRIFWYEDQPALCLEAKCFNVSARPINLRRIDPLSAIPAEGGSLYWPETAKLLTNGAMYYDPGHVFDFSQPAAEAQRSWWNIGLFRNYQDEGLVIGSLNNQTAQGQIEIQRLAGNELGLRAESALAPGFILPPGQMAVSNRFMLITGADPYQALEEYAAALGQLNQARISSTVNGWCSWFYTYETISEDEVLRNAAFAARHLKPFGLEYMQIDEGYQRWHGEWDGNERFPHGMKWLAGQIRKMGLKPGLWIAPYIISEPTAVFREHQDWLLRNPDGSLKRVGPWPSEDSDWARNENPKRYGLDISHPGAATWFYDLFDTVANRWGYEMIKIDFVDWSVLSAHQYYDTGLSRAQVYRRGYEMIRRAAGDKCHINECGPGPVSIGLVDSMRIELDQNYGYRRNVWQQYFQTPTSSCAAAAKRYYFHGKAWVNDADHLCLNLLSTTQAQAAASLLALTGGNLISGDRLTDLDPVRLDILRKTLPASGVAARPVDLLEDDIPSVFTVAITRPFARWQVAGFFNRDEAQGREFSYPLGRFGLDETKTYICFDFWKEELTAPVQGALNVRTAPAAATLLNLRPDNGQPQIVGTSRHLLMGAIELEEAVYDPASNTFSAVSLGAPDTQHKVFIYLPEARYWRQGKPSLYTDFPGFTLKLIDDHLLSVLVKFDQSGRTAWKIDFNQFFGA